LSWIEVVRMGIYVFFLILEKKFYFSSLTMMLTVGFLWMALSWWNTFLPYLVCQGFYHDSVLDFVRCFFCIHWDEQVVVIFYSVNVVCRFGWLVCIEPSLHPKDRSRWIVVYDPFNIMEFVVLVVYSLFLIYFH
jgi:hypothetical protein